MARVKLDGYKCERCDHKWRPRNDKHPTVCPKCKSPYWDKMKAAREKLKTWRAYK